LRENPGQKNPKKMGLLSCPIFFFYVLKKKLPFFYLPVIGNPMNLGVFHFFIFIFFHLAIKLILSYIIDMNFKYICDDCRARETVNGYLCFLGNGFKRKLGWPSPGQQR
jgi:hypothetical protein